MPNTLTNVIPKLLAQGLLALRQNAVMPHLVNTQYQNMAAQKGSTIDIPIPSAVTVQNVTPQAYSNATEDSEPTVAQVVMSRWREAPFYLTDKDMMEAMDGFIPMQASEAIKGLANDVDEYLLGLYTGVYNWAGQPGVTPFASGTQDAIDCRVALSNTLAPLGDRRMVIDANAEGNALNLRAFQDFSFSGDASGILNGEINRKLGFDWYMDQNVQTHTAGTASGATTDATGYALGATTVTLDSAGTGTILAGDIITFAGDNQTYVVTSGDADVSGGGTISFQPGLQVAIETSAHAITVKSSHTVNLAFHRDAIAFASRPLADVTDGMGNYIMSVGDPVSGLSLRLEVSREHKRTRFSYDILYGATLARRELACRLAG